MGLECDDNDLELKGDDSDNKYFGNNARRIDLGRHDHDYSMCDLILELCTLLNEFDSDLDLFLIF